MSMIAYDPNDNVIWGIGENDAECLRDLADCVEMGVITIGDVGRLRYTSCTSDLTEAVKVHGGKTPWTFDINGHAVSKVY